jgi:ribosomal peptide maturation radical SAM protein 1
MTDTPAALRHAQRTPIAPADDGPWPNPRILLVTMPWASLQRPSLALGILSEVLKSEAPAIPPVKVLYANLCFAEFLMKELRPVIIPDVYSEIAEAGYFEGAGEWVFSGALYDERDHQVPGFTEFTRGQAKDPSALLRMHRAAPVFISRLAEQIARESYDVIGFSSTFLQNVPSLALARRIKALQPDVTIVLGGGNCEGPMGAAIHRNFPFIDYVVRGEAEPILSTFVSAVSRASPDELRSIPGLCWREEGRSRQNPMTGVGSRRNLHSPAPDYDAYFDQVVTTGLYEWVQPELVLEGSRGCWWGEKHQCTFCGLNGEMMTFRRKPDDQIVTELVEKVTRHRVLDVVFNDNILSQDHLKTLMPRLATLGWDANIHFEVKANLRFDQLQLLSKAGVAHIQPGVESLNSHVLKIMDKGVTGWQNVRLLRDCRTLGIKAVWNYLYGFPGEEWEDYEAVLRQLPALVHLQPPLIACRIALERFSPYFENARLGIKSRGPAKVYRYIYDLPRCEVSDLVYLFDAEPAGIQGREEAEFVAAVDRWCEQSNDSRLTCRETQMGLIITDERVGWDHREYLLPRHSRGRAVFHSLWSGATMISSRRELHAAGVDVSEGEWDGWVEWATSMGLVFRDGSRYISLPVNDETLPIGIGARA